MEVPYQQYFVLWNFTDFRRQIDYTGWNLVFTKSGKYYFHDTVENISRYRPPEHLLEYLLELPAEKLDALFNPDADYEFEQPEFIEESEEYLPAESEKNLAGENEEYLSEEDYIVPSEDEPIEAEPRSLNPVIKKSAKEYSQAVDDYKQMLLESDIDPFQSWDSISTKLSPDPRFQALPAKERRSLFDSVCPVLAERARKSRLARLDSAQQTWRDTLSELTLVTAPATWTEYSRLIRRHDWFRLLDARIMEREYRDRLKELAERSKVYQIPR